MAPRETKDGHYALLGVAQTANLEVIGMSYRWLAVALHPDKSLNDGRQLAAPES